MYSPTSFVTISSVISIGKHIYGWVFLFIWPFCWVSIAIGEPTPLWITVAAFAVASTILPLIYCHLPGLNFADALGASVSPFCSGCMNVTILYIWIFLAPIFFYAVYLSVVGLAKGKAISQEKWHAFVARRLLG